MCYPNREQFSKLNFPIPNPKAPFQKLPSSFQVRGQGLVFCIFKNKKNWAWDQTRTQRLSHQWRQREEQRLSHSDCSDVRGERERGLFFVVQNWQVVFTCKLLQLFTTSSSLLFRLAETTTLAPCLTQWWRYIRKNKKKKERMAPFVMNLTYKTLLPWPLRYQKKHPRPIPSFRRSCYDWPKRDWYVIYLGTWYLFVSMAVLGLHILSFTRASTFESTSFAPKRSMWAGAVK